MNGSDRKDLYGLIGYPVSHSLSPAIFKAAFNAAGIDAFYELYPIAPEHLGEGSGISLSRESEG